MFRLRQPLIAGSTGFHVADLDLSVLVLAAALLVPFVGFLVPVLLRFDVRPGLANGLLVIFGKKVGFLAFVGVGMVLAQWFGAGRFQAAASKMGSAALSFVAFTALCIVTLTTTSTEFFESRINYYCLHHFQEAKCKALVESLPVKERDRLLEKVYFLEIELA